MKKLFCLILLFVAFGFMAQTSHKFYTKFGGFAYDFGYDVKQTLDNGYIITGSTSSIGHGNTDVYFIK